MKACSCVYCDVDGGWDLFSEKMVIARKEHKCEECREPILPGVMYFREVAKMPGETTIFSNKTCLDCLSIRKAFFCDGFYVGFAWEMLEDHVHEECRYSGTGMNEDCLRDLTPKARAKVCALIEAAWEEFGEDEEEI